MLEMTEEEAKTKWCPFARLIAEMRSNLGNVGFTESHNRRATEDGDGFPSAARCIGSSCMAWRWKSLNESGYCGLAGKP
jgi:hypothetical protein